MGDIDGITLKAIIDYCYTDRIEINADNADDILDAASRMEFPAIEEMVGQFWCDNLTVENCIETLAKADQYCLMVLWQKALQFCGANFDKLPLPNMLNMDVGILRKLLAETVTEMQILDYVEQWLQHNVFGREKFAPSILKLIRLKHFTSKVSKYRQKNILFLKH